MVVGQIVVLAVLEALVWVMSVAIAIASREARLVDFVATPATFLRLLGVDLGVVLVVEPVNVMPLEW